MGVTLAHRLSQLFISHIPTELVPLSGKALRDLEISFNGYMITLSTDEVPSNHAFSGG